jgi:hypothetical protein
MQPLAATAGLIAVTPQALCIDAKPQVPEAMGDPRTIALHPVQMLLTGQADVEPATQPETR